MKHAHSHSHPIGVDEDGAAILVDNSHPCDSIEPLQLPDNQAERDAALAGIRWMLETIGVGGVLMKWCALRYLLKMEDRSLEVVAAELGFTRAAISKYITQFADAFQLEGGKSRRARGAYREAQKRAWKRIHGRGERIAKDAKAKLPSSTPAEGGHNSRGDSPTPAHLENPPK